MPQVMTFKPAISKRAHELPSRSFEELSEGDRLRRDCYLVRDFFCEPKKWLGFTIVFVIVVIYISLIVPYGSAVD